MYEISVIVPVYNLEKYIPKCIESLINQTIFNKLEIILVNDGSTDNSMAICSKYAAEYPNIILLNQSNGGVSTARNLGVKYATAKYLAFADGDDYIDEAFYENMLIEISKDDYQLVVFDYYLELENGKRIPYRNISEHVSWNNESLMKDFLSGNLVGQNLFDKLFLTENIKQIDFDPQIRIGEDFLFIFEYIKTVKSAMGIFEPGYYYVQRNGSAMNDIFSNKMFDPIVASTRIKDWAETNYMFYDYAYAHYIHTIYKVLERAYKSNNYKKYEKEINDYEEILKNYSLFKARKYLSKKQFIGLLLMRLSPKLYLYVCKIKNI